MQNTTDFGDWGTEHSAGGRGVQAWAEPPTLVSLSLNESVEAITLSLPPPLFIYVSE